MAAVAIPLIAGILPDVINLISALVHKHAPTAEQAGTTGTGAVKFADVFTAIMKDLVAAHAAGTIPTLPDDATVKIIQQAVVNSLKLLGALSTPTPDPVPAGASSQVITVKSGDAITIRVA